MSATIELTPEVFRQWTDGPKVVIDTLGTGIGCIAPNLTYIATSCESDLTEVINVIPLAASVYVIGTQATVNAVQQLVQKSNTVYKGIVPK